MSATSFEHHARRPRHAPVRGAFGRSLGKWLAIGLVALVAFTFAGPIASRLWRGIDPFASKTVDRSQPALLQAITQMHDYRAASGTFQVVVDVEKDAKWMPAAIRGERTVLMAEGNVDAGVDLRSITASSLVVDRAAKSVTITLPHARLRSAHIDLARSKVIERRRGMLDRLGSTFGGAPASDQAIFRLAERKLHAAAVASTVRTVAETNTRAMLSGLVTGLGFEHVRVVFVDAARPATSPSAPSAPSAPVAEIANS